MKRVLTAIDNSEICKELSENYEIICKDISYKEGILEQIEINKKIDLIILDDRIDGDIELNILIKKIKEKIKKIEILIITDNKNKIINETKRYKRIKIYETNKIKIKKLNNIININEEEKVKKQKNEKEIIINNKKNIINISGADGVGKTMISIIFSKMLKVKNTLIEFNLEENYDMSLILNNKKIKNNLVSENKFLEIKKIINRNENENIIIDLGNKIKNEEKKFILKNSKINLIILEPNIIGIKKCKKLINDYIEKFEIKKSEILLLINNKNQYSIDEKIIKNIFKKIKIIGVIDNDLKYDKFMNNEFKNLKLSLTMKEKRNYKKILNNIFNKKVS